MDKMARSWKTPNLTSTKAQYNLKSTSTRHGKKINKLRLSHAKLRASLTLSVMFRPNMFCFGRYGLVDLI